MEFKVHRNSATSSETEPIVIAETGTTRKVVIASLHDNPKDAAAPVKISIRHQRKGIKDTWEEVDSTPLSALKAGEAAAMSLNSASTLNLSNVLRALYARYDSSGLPRGTEEWALVDASRYIEVEEHRVDVIQALLNRDAGEQFWNMLAELSPEKATEFSRSRTQELRVRSLAKFHAMLGDPSLPEGEWQQFFDANSWIFGYGLGYKINTALEGQPHYGGMNIDGKGGQRGDGLAATEGAVKFTVLVEIKKPTTELLGPKYRNAAYPASRELAGAIAQLQANCRTFEVSGSRTDESRDRLGDILTVRPKGILVIGNLDSLRGREQRTSFELMRRATTNPEIITFDELFARAKFIVEGDGSSGDTGPSGSRVDGPGIIDDDIPF